MKQEQEIETYAKQFIDMMNTWNSKIFKKTLFSLGLPNDETEIINTTKKLIIMISKKNKFQFKLGDPNKVESYIEFDQPFKIEKSSESLHSFLKKYYPIYKKELKREILNIF